MRFGRTMNKRWRMAVAAVLTVMVGVSAYLVWPGNQPMQITAYFPTARGIYPGDDVDVLGVKVGTIDSIDPEGTRVKVVMNVDHGTKIPQQANAIIVAQSLVTARFVQLTPAYKTGPLMTDGYVIPESRTAVPVEWDEIKKQLDKLTKALGPNGDDPGALPKLLSNAAANLKGNGQTIHDTLRQVSQAMHTLSKGRTDLFGTIKNLQVFVSALAASDQQIVEFGGHLASVSQVLADSNDQLGDSLKELNTAVLDIQNFVSHNRDAIKESVSRLADATQVLADKKDKIAEVLHAGPTSLVNFYNIYQPAQGSMTGAIALNNFANPVNFICGMMAGVDGVGPDKAAQMCAAQLGPILKTLTMNYPPVGTNPLSGSAADPGQVVYTSPDLHNVPGIPQPSLPPNGTPITEAHPRRVPASGLPGLMVPQGGTK